VNEPVGCAVRAPRPSACSPSGANHRPRNMEQLERRNRPGSGSNARAPDIAGVAPPTLLCLPDYRKCEKN
jgi:hypothetical protein